MLERGYTQAAFGVYKLRGDALGRLDKREIGVGV
jgi:hypothetical protein